ncbi:PRC-barrel domain-containing protein [Capilliphycus salinus ALCB114379]|uniref:PRC-barrel domain-containing protein n=1 Tax=Capilliphycus salinus TaxID=2768948 RepID=UPI0039A47BDA
MNTETQMIKRSELINRLVLERNTVEDLGRVEQLWINPQSHQVVALTCKSGLIRGQKRVFTWDNIVQIGDDAVLVNRPISQEESDENPTKPEQAIHGMNHEVWTDAGNKIGSIVDYIFEQKTGFINHYLYTSQGLRGVLEGVYILPATAVSSAGNKRLIVLEAAIKTPQQYSEGWGQKMGQAAEFIQEDFEKTREHIEGLKRNAQKITKGKQEGMKEIEVEIISEEREPQEIKPKELPANSGETNSDRDHS